MKLLLECPTSEFEKRKNRNLPVDVPLRDGEQEGEADFESLGGVFRIEQANASLMLALPRSIHVPVSKGKAGRLAQLIRREVPRQDRRHIGYESASP